MAHGSDHRITNLNYITINRGKIIGKGKLEAFSNGVLAIIITIMAQELV